MSTMKKTAGLRRINVAEMNEQIKMKRQESQNQLSKRLQEHELNNVTTQKQKYHEMVVRMNDNDKNIIQNILKLSNTKYELYRKTRDEGYSGELLVALGLMSKNENRKFQYIYNNDMSDQMYSGSIDIYDQVYQEQLSERYHEFEKQNSDLIDRLSSGNEQYNEDQIKRLPTIYILGDRQSYESVDMMCLPTKVRQLNTEDDLDILEDDQNNKCVIMFKTANPALGRRFSEIRNAQHFSLLLAFHKDDYDTSNEIVPFNRNTILNHFNVH